MTHAAPVGQAAEPENVLLMLMMPASRVLHPLGAVQWAVYLVLPVQHM
jgi:hypothetical protein